MPRASGAAYRERVNADEREEIAASIAAHAELGPRYETAVAEGLVERIGEEIDKRVDARLRGQQPATGPVTVPLAPAASPAPARRSNGVTGMFLGLGSMGLGVGVTAVVVANKPAAGAEVIIILLIWFAIAVVNIAHSQRH